MSDVEIREPKTQTRIPFLDGWRGLAITLVLVGHFIPIPGSDAGRAGVELFFLLSGLLMARLLVEKQVSLKVFFPRRIGRVLPALLGFLLVAISLQVLLPSTFGQRNLTDEFSVVTFWSNYRFLDSHPRIFGHTWSLSIEEHSYVFLGLMAALVSRRERKAANLATATLLLMWAWGIYLHQAGGDYHAVYWRSDVRGASILLGFVLYLRRQIIVDLFNRWPRALLGTTLLAGPLLLIRAVPSPAKYTLGTLLCGIFLVSMFSDRHPTRGMFRTKALTLLGKWSYSIYLFQQIAHVAKTSTPAWTWPLWGVVAIASGLIGYRLLEVPGQRIVDRLSNRAR